MSQIDDVIGHKMSRMIELLKRVPAEETDIAINQVNVGLTWAPGGDMPWFYSRRNVVRHALNEYTSDWSLEASKVGFRGLVVTDDKEPSISIAGLVGADVRDEIGGNTIFGEDIFCPYKNGFYKGPTSVLEILDCNDLMRVFYIAHRFLKDPDINRCLYGIIMLKKFSSIISMLEMSECNEGTIDIPLPLSLFTINARSLAVVLCARTSRYGKSIKYSKKIMSPWLYRAATSGFLQYRGSKEILCEPMKGITKSQILLADHYYSEALGRVKTCLKKGGFSTRTKEFEISKNKTLALIEIADSPNPDSSTYLSMFKEVVRIIGYIREVNKMIINKELK